jgi:hypothetical protein
MARFLLVINSAYYKCNLTKGGIATSEKFSNNSVLEWALLNDTTCLEKSKTGLLQKETLELHSTHEGWNV